jgi:hypothetical protein
MKLIKNNFLSLHKIKFIKMIEIWKDIPGYEGSYQISSLGRVKSTVLKDEKIMKLKLCKKGYYEIHLTKNKKAKTFRIHQLVAFTFLNHTPNGQKTVVDHINNDKLDNRVENLQLISNRENCSKDVNKVKTTSKYIGVSFNKKTQKWVAQMRIDGKKTGLGYFKTEIEAYEKYQEKLKLLES